MKTMSFINWKGGVGKSSISLTTAYILAEMGAKVLFIDNDKQGNASRWFEADAQNYGSLADIILTDEDVQNTIQPTRYPNIDLIRAGKELRDAIYQPVLNQNINQNDILRTALEPIKDQYHICITDNAPDDNIIIMNVLGISDFIFAITELTEWAIDGVDALRDALQGFNDVMPGHNSGITGIIVNKYVPDPQSLKMLKVLEDKGYTNIFRPYLRESRTTKAQLKICVNEHKCICEVYPRCAFATDVKALVKSLM